MLTAGFTPHPDRHERLSRRALHRVAGLVLPPVAGVAALVGTYALWERLWLAAVIAVPFAAAVRQALTVGASQPRVHRDVGHGPHDDALTRRGFRRIRQ